MWYRDLLLFQQVDARNKQYAYLYSNDKALWPLWPLKAIKHTNMHIRKWALNTHTLAHKEFFCISEVMRDDSLCMEKQ